MQASADLLPSYSSFTSLPPRSRLYWGLGACAWSLTASFALPVLARKYGFEASEKEEEELRRWIGKGEGGAKKG